MSGDLRGVVDIRAGATAEDLLHSAVEAAGVIAAERGLHAVNVRLVGFSLDPAGDAFPGYAMFAAEAIAI